MSGPLTLAIATAGPVGAAIVGDGVERSAATGAQALSGALRCVNGALAESGHAIYDIDLVAVCCGPGSFTGLRIGVALAKSIAQARGLPILGIASYDIVDAGSIDPYPRAALVEGKRDFYYARIIADEAAAPRFLSGTPATLGSDLSGLVVRDLADLSAGEQALRIARIARIRSTDGSAHGWQAVDIDYGGRPNAVVNWERRRLAQERGGAANSSNLKRR